MKEREREREKERRRWKMQSGMQLGGNTVLASIPCPPPSRSNSSPPPARFPRGILCVVLPSSLFTPRNYLLFSFSIVRHAYRRTNTRARVLHYNPRRQLSTHASDNDMTAEDIAERAHRGAESPTRGFYFSRRQAKKNDAISRAIKGIKAAGKELCRAIELTLEEKMSASLLAARSYWKRMSSRDSHFSILLFLCLIPL